MLSFCFANRHRFQHQMCLPLQECERNQTGKQRGPMQ